jgi:hypothetical protein
MNAFGNSFETLLASVWNQGIWISGIRLARVERSGDISFIKK